MKKIILVAIGLTVFNVFAQVNIQWEERYSSSGANIDQAVDMVIDASGNSYVTGTSFNTGAGFDIVTVAYDNLGTQQWVNTLNGSNNSIDEAFAMDLDPTGFIYVAGYVHQGTIDYDVVVHKINVTTGAVVWTQTYDNNGYYDLARDIVVDAAGDVYVVGSTQINASGSNTDFLILKYNSNGTLLWEDTYTRDVTSSSNLDEAMTLVLTGSKLYVTGTSSGSGLANNQDFVTMEYDTAQTGTANYNWRTRYDYNAAPDIPVSIDVDPSGNIYVAGRGYFDANNDMNYVLVKYDNTGVQIWDEDYNGTGTDKDNVNAMAIDAAGNCIITGSSIGSVTAEDIRTLKYDPNGTLLWNMEYTSSGSFIDEGTDISVSATGDVYVSAYSSVTGNSHDFTTIKYDGVSGAELWVTQYDGSGNNSDKALTMALDATENIYIAGGSTGIGTNQDYMTIKYCQLTTDAGSDTSICINQSVQLDAIGGNTFAWTVVSGDPINVGTNFSCSSCHDPIASPTVTTTYAVSSTNANGCTDFDTITVMVNPLPGPTIYALGPLSFCDGDSVILYSDSSSTYSWNTGSVNDSIVADTSGTYILTVTDALGCLNTASQVVTVYNLPIVDAGIPDSICPGDSTQLLATGADTYLWTYNPDLNMTAAADPWAVPTMDTIYYVTGEDANGCFNSDSVTVHVFPAPVAPIIAHNDPLDLLTSTSSTGNQWYLNGIALGGETNQTYTYAFLGDYYILYTDPNGCSIWSDTVKIDSVNLAWDGIEELANLDLLIYPNPSNGLFYADLTLEKNETIDVRVTDLNGRLLWSKQSVWVDRNKTIVMDLSHLAVGIYTVVFTSNGGLKSKRIVIK